MTRLPSGIAAAFLALALHGPPALGAVEIFLRIDGPRIDGESTAVGHEKWIDILSYSWGASHFGSTTGGVGFGLGKPTAGDFSFAKLLDASSPLLFQAVASGKHYDTAILDVVDVGAGQTSQPYLKYTLSDILVSSFQQSASSGGDRPLDSFSLNFAKVKMEYRPIDSKSGNLGPPIVAEWDFAKGGGEPPPIPEPSTWALLVGGLASLAWWSRRRAAVRAS